MLIKRFNKFLERVVRAHLVAASSFVCTANHYKQFINNHKVIHLWNGFGILKVHISVKMLFDVKQSWRFGKMDEVIHYCPPKRGLVFLVFLSVLSNAYRKA